MRVLQLGPYPPPHGGVQYNLVAIHRNLARRGISSEIINLTRFRQEDGDGVYFPANSLELLRLLLRLEYDIIHLHIGGSLTRRLLGLSFVCSSMPRSKSVLTFHSGGYPGSKEGRTAGPKTLRGFIFRRFDAIISVNPEIAGLFEKFGVEHDRIRLIYPFSRPEIPEGQSLPEPLAGFFQAHAPLFITVGLLEPEYDLSAQIRVLGRIRERYAGAGLVIIGSGSLEQRLRDEIAATEYPDHILLCGDIPHPVTMQAIKESSRFLRTTLYDGDSIAVREALYLGTPVIATDTGMRPEGVRLIPVSDIDALHDAIVELEERPAVSPSAGGAGEENIEAVYELYRELLA